MFLYLQVLINKKDNKKYKQQHRPTKSEAEFIQGINNCLQMNTYWNYIV